MGKRLCLFVLVIALFSLSFVSSAHYISGYAENAKDGTNVNNREVILWNPVYGESDKLSDIVGVNGRSGYTNVYMFDCELLQNGCNIGDELRVRVVDSGDGYVSNYSSVIVTSAGYDMLDNVTLNSPPVAEVVSPQDGFITNKQEVEITCSFSDLDEEGGELSLYSDHTGTWKLFETKIVVSNQAKFNVTYTSGTYKYACYANDYFNSDFSSNRTIIIDLMEPVINSLIFNESNFCGPTPVRVTCDTFDDISLSEVFIEIFSPSDSLNVTANHLSADLYYVDYFIDEVGDWSFQCISRDNATNLEYGEVLGIHSYSGNPDLFIDSERISFSKMWPAERENVTVSLNVSNLGCVDTSSFIVSFYEGEPGNGGVQFGENISVSIQKFSEKVVDILFETTIGFKNIFAEVDVSNVLVEDNESNNLGNSSFSVVSWQEFYGNITSVKVLSDGSDQFGGWDNDSSVEGYVFMADSEAEINWMELRALGRTKSGGYSSSDFSEVDSLLSMGNYFDSVSNEYSSFVGRDCLIHQKNIEAVPAVQSTDNDNFYTGILWDSSDSVDSEFDSIEKEDLVFVSKVNQGALGKYGSYDYEIRVPAKLREYDNSNTEDIYFYYELI